MFRKFGSRIAAALGLASQDEKQVIIRKLQAAVDTPVAQAEGSNTTTVPYDPPRPRLRDRNTKFSRRDPARLPRYLNAEVNNKQVQFMMNPLLQRLLWSSGAMGATHPKVEVAQ